MNNQECTQAYEMILDLLNQSGLGWVAGQVMDEVRLGKTVEKEIDTLKESPAPLSWFPDVEHQVSLKKGPRARFPVTIEYDAVERLQLLLDAVEQVMVNTADMEQHIAHFFNSETDHWLGVNFQSEEPDSVPAVITMQTIVPRLETANHLKELLDALRAEIAK